MHSNHVYVLQALHVAMCHYYPQHFMRVSIDQAHHFNVAFISAGRLLNVPATGVQLAMFYDG